MKERRRRVAESKRAENDPEKVQDQKEIVIRGFSAQQLEDMLKSSTRSIAQELVSCLADEKGRGVLSEIIRLLSQKTTQQDKTVLEGKNIHKTEVLSDIEEEPSILDR